MNFAEIRGLVEQYGGAMAISFHMLEHLRRRTNIMGLLNLTPFFNSTYGRCPPETRSLFQKGLPSSLSLFLLHLAESSWGSLSLNDPVAPIVTLISSVHQTHKQSERSCYIIILIS